ncbi:nucleoside phosphorylase domain-containing protein [Aspergillus granulosus]|uniref:Nucleoside phosphorylase domain-containing protein n=1 Tax=Aspergillus granulosus TaxID=176169 RepID=A0ABR4GZ22_9EURO
MPTTRATLALDDYTVAWIYPNAYDFGELNGHNIVITYLPYGVYGTVSAVTVVSRMRMTFPRLHYELIVGTGGGVPSQSHDIRLGDVVVSRPGEMYGVVIQYDYGKAVQGEKFEQTGFLNQSPQALLTHISQLESKKMTGGAGTISSIVSAALERNPRVKERFSAPEQHTDLLFRSSYHRVDKKLDCKNAPYVHYGLIASGDQVMKDSEARDRLAEQHGILCFEMEASGLMNELPTLVIRGICDYGDSHKQKEWQGYAALTAAAYARILLLGLPFVSSFDWQKDKAK